jgi:hypothetical protein
MPPRIIALCGRKQVGKDTIGTILQKFHGYTPIKFAAPLKRSMQALFGFSHEQIDGIDKDLKDPRYGCTPRTIMQFFGTEIMQSKLRDVMPQCGRDFFVKRLIESLLPNTNYVITDVRFKHEAEGLRRAFPGDQLVIITITRDSPHQDSHVSETEWRDVPCDFTIENNGTLDDLIFKMNEKIRTL